MASWTSVYRRADAAAAALDAEAAAAAAAAAAAEAAAAAAAAAAPDAHAAHAQHAQSHDHSAERRLFEMPWERSLASVRHALARALLLAAQGGGEAAPRAAAGIARATAHLEYVFPEARAGRRALGALRRRCALGACAVALLRRRWPEAQRAATDALASLDDGDDGGSGCADAAAAAAAAEAGGGALVEALAEAARERREDRDAFALETGLGLALLPQPSTPPLTPQSRLVVGSGAGIRTDAGARASAGFDGGDDAAAAAAIARQWRAADRHQRLRALLYRAHAQRQRDEYEGSAADLAAALRLCDGDSDCDGQVESNVCGAFAAAARGELARLQQQKVAYRLREARLARAMLGSAAAPAGETEVNG